MSHPILTGLIAISDQLYNPIRKLSAIADLVGDVDVRMPFENYEGLSMLLYDLAGELEARKGDLGKMIEELRDQAHA